MYMTKVERMIYDEAFEDGERSGILHATQKANNAFSSLNLALLADQRYADLELASKDSCFREKLFEEYGITY